MKLFIKFSQIFIVDSMEAVLFLDNLIYIRQVPVTADCTALIMVCSLEEGSVGPYLAVQLIY